MSDDYVIKKTVRDALIAYAEAEIGAADDLAKRRKAMADAAEDLPTEVQASIWKNIDSVATIESTLRSSGELLMAQAGGIPDVPREELEGKIAAIGIYPRRRNR